jgi:ATP-dependent DNA ligase
MLATLTDERFSREGWIFERKVDGERVLAFRRGRNLRLLSRNRKRLNGAYPELVEALAEQEAGDFVADAEVAANGASSHAATPTPSATPCGTSFAVPSVPEQFSPGLSAPSRRKD